MAACDFRYVICDVFTDSPLAGNALAVFTDAQDIPERSLQPLARELNLSETVFVYPATDGGDVRLRIFTPAAELAFAGHPVLGAAFVLALPLQLTEMVLETGAGPIRVVLEREGSRISFGWMAQPSPTVEPVPEEQALLAVLGVAEAVLPVELYDNGITHVCVALRSVEDVMGLRPDLAALATMPHVGTSCFALDGTTVTTRMFAPGVGVAEDPATGSAAGPLACHLVRHGRIESGADLVIRQGDVVGRPGTLYARAWTDGDDVTAVEVGGAAVVVARGEFRLRPPLSG